MPRDRGLADRHGVGQRAVVLTTADVRPVPAELRGDVVVDDDVPSVPDQHNDGPQTEGGFALVDEDEANARITEATDLIAVMVFALLFGIAATVVNSPGLVDSGYRGADYDYITATSTVDDTISFALDTKRARTERSMPAASSPCNFAVISSRKRGIASSSLKTGTIKVRVSPEIAIPNL